MTTLTGLSGALTRYAERFHGSCGDGHHVASPLGAWLLVALCARAATDATRQELTDVLGADADAAARVADSLLSTPHPLVGSAAALWHAPVEAPSWSTWLAGLPESVAVGDLPTQAELDNWASEHTLGLIRRFPLSLTPETLLVLATALATRVSWERPFEVVPAADLGPGGAWAGRIQRALSTPGGRGYGHTQYIATTERAGDVAVHIARARAEHTDDGYHGLSVMSVIAAADVAAGDVMASAYELATGAEPARRSLFDLPLGDSPLWTVREEAASTTALNGREERCTAVLPAWSAESEHDLDHAGLGIPAAARALAGPLALPEYRYEAKQSAMARYSRVGFEAAAVTGAAMALAYQQPRDGIRRVARLRFAHPYAVVAVSSGKPGPWDGLPVFSAWVADPEDAEGAEDVPTG